MGYLRIVLIQGVREYPGEPMLRFFCLILIGENRDDLSVMKAEQAGEVIDPETSILCRYRDIGDTGRQRIL